MSEKKRPSWATPKAAERHATREPWPEADDRIRCVVHQQPEPCGICESYIAAGL